MKWYIARRVAWAGIASLIILTITFLLMDLVPDQRVLEAEFQAAQEGVDIEEAAQAERERLGIDDPLYVRYFEFLTNLFQGDWGWSDQYDQPVWDTIVETAPYSMMYAIPAIVLSTIIGTAIGLYSAVNQYTKKDYTATFVAFFGVSIPDWWFGIILLVIFGNWLGGTWFGFEFLLIDGWQPTLAQSANGDITLFERAGEDHPSAEPNENIGVFSWNNIRQLILPTFTLMTGAIASVMRYSRAEALEYVDSEFVKTAKSKGVSSWKIVAQHIFRPASIPLMTIFVGRLFGLVLAGSYLIEVVFGIPGIGLASFEALINNDHDLVLVTILIPTFLVVLGNLAEDIMYAFLDPRIDYGDR